MSQQSFAQHTCDVTSKNDLERTFWDVADKQASDSQEEEPPPTHLTDDHDKRSFVESAPERAKQVIESLPPLIEIENVIQPQSTFDISLPEQWVSRSERVRVFLQLNEDWCAC